MLAQSEAKIDPLCNNRRNVRAELRPIAVIQRRSNLIQKRSFVKICQRMSANGPLAVIHTQPARWDSQTNKKLVRFNVCGALTVLEQKTGIARHARRARLTWAHARRPAPP